LDFSAITGSVYDGYFLDLYLNVGGKCIFFNGTGALFSIKFDTIIGSSYNDHVFHVYCGPGTSWINCYAENCPTGKVGYRLAGYVHMYSCNGVNVGAYWGAFGSNTSGTDGFQSDFSFTDYPDVQLYNCNVENFSTTGIQLVGPVRGFRFVGGSFVKTGSTAYNSIITFVGGGTSNAIVQISPGIVILGTGVPNGGGSLTNAYVRAIVNIPMFEFSGQMIANGITGYYADVIGGLYPWITQSGKSDVYGDMAMFVNAITPRRLSMQMVRYATPAALTPVGAGQAIDVTGYTKVTVTPAAAASINQATFTQTVGAGLDYGRNGDLLIEAGNGNLTILHLGTGATGAFRMAGAANLTLTAGQVVRFCWSSTSSQWIQV
jgi:hypothetical protein